jgi:hypothetical protein
MKKLILLPLLFFVLACYKAPVENTDLTKNVAAPTTPADSTAKWTRNVLPNFYKIVKGDYKDGKLSKGEGC